MINLPKQTYIVIDPCYVMTDEAYDAMCDQLSFENRDAQLVTINGIQMAVASTKYGDGDYPSNLSMSFPVDAGIIAAVPFALCAKDKLESEMAESQENIIADSTVWFNQVDGTFFINDIEIYTGDDEHHDDEFDW